MFYLYNSVYNTYLLAVSQLFLWCQNCCFINKQ